MELTSQVANLQDEVKLLKGEIKAVLKDIRAAVLSENNPFALNAAPSSAPGPVAWPGTGEQRPEQQGGPVQVDRAEAAAPVPVLPAQPPPPPAPAAVPPDQAASSFPAPQVAADPVYMPPFEGVARSRESFAGAAAESPAPIATPPQAPAAQEPIPFPSVARDERRRRDDAPAAAGRGVREDEEEPAQGPTWNLLTVASLAVWAEDALATLGPKSFHLVLELATFAELLPPEVRDVFRGLADLSSQQQAEHQPVTVNEYLLVLRQLEAILQGDDVAKLPRRRGRRRHRAR